MRLSQGISGMYAMIAMTDSEALVILNIVVIQLESARISPPCSLMLDTSREEEDWFWRVAGPRFDEFDPEDSKAAL